MTLWPVATYDGFINPVPAVNSDGPLTAGALLLLWVGVLLAVAFVIYGHNLYAQNVDEVGVVLSVLPGIVGGLFAAYLMRHYDSGWSSLLTALVVVMPIAVSVLVHGLKLRGLGGASIFFAALGAGGGFVFDALNRMSAAIPLSVSGLLILVVIGAVWAANS